MFSTDLTQEDKGILLDLAEASVSYGIERGEQMPVVAKEFNARLQQILACFVTLKIQDQLRGCIGTLEARQPLVENVVHYAYAAAFQDPRFEPVSARELTQLQYEISVLSAAEPIHAENETALLRQLEQGEDGLILEDGLHRATFLPAVWEQLMEPELFFCELKRKAGLPRDYWSSTLQCYRYRAEKFERL